MPAYIIPYIYTICVMAVMHACSDIEPHVGCFGSVIHGSIWFSILGLVGFRGIQIDIQRFVRKTNNG